MTETSKGSKYWTNSKSQLHRIDGPAIITASGIKAFYLNGQHIEDAEFIKLIDGNPENILVAKLKYNIDLI